MNVIDFFNQYLIKYAEESKQNLLYIVEYGWFSEESDAAFPAPALNGFYPWLIERVGGREGSGEHTHSIMSMINATTGEVVGYVRMTGVYNSYNGTEWDEDFVEVVQREVLVTQFFDKE